LEQAVEALDVSLSASDVDYLEDPYEPKPVKPIFVRPSDGPYRPVDPATSRDGGRPPRVSSGRRRDCHHCGPGETGPVALQTRNS